MYASSEQQMILPDDFFLPFGGKLNKNNRWVKLAQMIPWWKVEQHYEKQFKSSTRGQKAYSVRVALGALIIQERLGLSDRETVQQITENPYLQYFLGLPRFQEEPPFHPSLLTHFRKRFDAHLLQQVNEWILEEEEAKSTPSNDSNAACSHDDHDDHDDDDHGAPGEQASSCPPNTPAKSTHGELAPNKGKLLLDATCAPADIAYPTDLTLLNEAREKLEAMIDCMHQAREPGKRKPRTYREKARKAYLAVAKRRCVKPHTMRKAIGQQLRYVRRDLRIIETLKDEIGLQVLSRKQYRDLLVIQELYRQQEEMYRKRTKRIDDRIVSISQPHVRPIVRGKARANVEFGAKAAISLVDGYARLERLAWSNFHEGHLLQEAAEAYRKRYGYYPEAILADKIFRTRENLKYCKERGIRLSGPPLGRPSPASRSEQAQFEKQDTRERNAIEGKFGEGKRFYGLGLVRTRLQRTSETVIALTLLVMNLERRLRLLLYAFLRLFFRLAPPVQITTS